MSPTCERIEIGSKQPPMNRQHRRHPSFVREENPINQQVATDNNVSTPDSFTFRRSH